MTGLRIMLVAATLAACDGGTTGPTPDKACTDSATGSCMAYEACSMNWVEERYGTMDQCIARLKANCLVSLTAPGTGATPTGVEACAQAYPTASCADLLYGNIAACQAATGTLAIGAPCSYHGQCSTAFCSFAPGAGCGHCAPASMPGDDCSASSCSHPLACIADAVDMTETCEPYGAAGASCDKTGHACGYELACVIPSGATTGTCVQQGTTVGTACDGHLQTASNCTGYEGLFCSPTTKQCAAVAYVPAGSPCGYQSSTGMDAVCTGASSCWKGAGGKATCLALALEGQACDTMLGPGCMGPSRCVTGGGGTAGVCALPTPSQCM